MERSPYEKTEEKQKISYHGRLKSAIMQAIARTDYSGYVGQEFNPVGDPGCGIKVGVQTM